MTEQYIVVRANLYLNIHNGAVDLLMKYLSATSDPNNLIYKKYISACT